MRISKRPHVRASRVLLVLLAGLALSGCALPGRSPATPVATYVLETADTTAPLQSATTKATLRISMPISAPEFASSRMAYIEQPYRIDYFAQHAWADTPARMLKPLLTRHLAGSGLFGFVFADSAGVDESLRLDSNIIELAQWFTPSSSEIHLTIRFDLIDVEHRTILLSQTISITEAATAREPYAGVIAANRAVQRAVDQLITLLHDPVIAFGERISDSTDR